MSTQTSNIKPIRKPIYIISISIISAIIFSILLINFYIGKRITTVYSPMIDAAMELKYEVTSAHLWFEEILSGDKEEDIQQVYVRLEYAQWFLNAMSNGDENDHGTFIKIDDPTIISHLGRLDVYIDKLISLTILRYNLHDKGKAGTETDKQYDAIFNDFLDEAFLLEANLKNFITNDINELRTIQLILFVLIFLAALFVVVIFNHYEKQRTKSIKQLEHEIKEKTKTEKRFEDIAKSTGEWIWETNSEGMYTYGSSAVENILGYKLNDIIAKKYFYDFFETDKKEDLKIAAMDVFDKKESFKNFENINIDKNGNKVILRTSAFPMLDDDGNLLGYRGVDLDITEQKMLTEEIYKSGEKYRAIFENTSVGMGISDNQARILDVNETMCNITGFSYDEMLALDLGKTYVNIDDRTKLKKLLTNNNKVELFELQLYKKNGDKYWASISVNPIEYNGEMVFLTTQTDINERKLAKIELENQHFYLDQAQKTGNIGSWNLELLNNKLEWTDQNYRIFGVPIGTKNLTYETFLECVHPDDRKFVNEEWTKSLKTGDYDIEHRLLVKGQIKWVREKAELLIDNEGNCTRATGVTQDITEQKLIEIELQEKEAIYRLLSKNSLEAIWATDLELNTIFISNAVFKFLGYTPEEILEKNTLEITVPEDLRILEVAAKELLDKHKKGDRVQTVVEIHQIKKDGTVIDVEVFASLLLDDSGQAIGFQGRSIDITNKKLAAKKLKTNENLLAENLRKLNLHLEHTPLAVIEWDTNFNVVSWNKAAEKTFGYTENEVVGRHADFLVPEKIREEVGKIGNNILLQKESTRSSNANITKNGNFVECEWFNTPLITTENEVIGIASLILDITEKTQQNKEIVKQRHFLDKAQEIGNIGTWSLDLINNKLEWTDENYRIFGVPIGTKNLAYETFLECVHPEDREYVNEEWIKSLNTGDYDIEHRLLVKGEIKWVREKADLLFDNERNCTNATGVTQDITMKKLVAIELKEREAKFRLLSTNSQDNIWTTDLEFKITYINNTVFNQIGYTPEEMYAVDVSVYILPEDIILLENTAKKLLLAYDNNRETLQTTIEVRHLKKDGTLIDVEITANLLLDDSGQAIGFQGRSEDISASKLSEIKLKEKESELLASLQKLNLHIENTPLAVIEWGLDFNVLKWNKAAEDIFGYNMEEAIGRHAAGLIVPEEAKEEVDKIWNELLTLKGGNRNTNSNNKKNGEIIECEWYNTPLITAAGKVIGVASLVHDVTDQKRSKQALQSIATQFTNISGQQFFEKVCLHLTETLHMDFAFIGELVSNENKVRVKAGIENGVILDKFEYEIANTPCENVIDKTFCCFTSGIRDLFPKDHLLVEMEIESYAGIPLFNSNGDALGIIVVLDRKPISNEPNVKSLLQIFSERVAAEIERNLALEKLQESENRFRSLIEQAGDSMFLADFNGNIIDVNNSTCKKLGYNREELISMNISNIDLVFADENIREKLMIKLNSEGVVTIESVNKQKDGTEFPVEIKIGIIEITGEKRMLGFARDITDRKLAEKSLLDSEYQLKESQKIANLGSYVLDLTSGIWNSSEILNDIFGIDNNFNRSISNWVQMIYDEDQTMMQQYFEKNVLTNHESFNKEYRIKRISDQKILWVHGLGKLEFNDDGNPTKMIGTIQDITERKENELKILKLNKAIEQSPSTIVITDLGGNIEYVNKSFEETTGYTKEEAIGQNPRILKSGNLSQELYTDLWETISSGKTWRGEFLNKKKNSALYWEDAIISPVKDDGNNTINYIAIKTDITELKLLQLKLKKYNVELEERVAKRTKQFIASEENYRTLAETMDEYICRLDNEKKITFMNSSLLKVLGKEKGDVVGSNLDSILKLFSKNENIEVVELVIQQGKSTKLVDKVPWGEWVEWHLIFENSKIKNHGNIIIVGHDITQRKQLESKMKTALIKEKELNKLKTQFVSTVSHEFRTPLTSIYSSIELVERYGEKWDHSKKQDHFNRIKTSIEHLTNMLEEMLLLSRTESGKIEFHPESIDLSKFCDSVIKDSIPLLSKEQSFNYSYSLPKEEYYIDRNLLRVILTNLISNAIKYSPGEKKIDIDVSGQKDKIKFTIKDNGMGISEADMKHLFVPFYRSDEASTITGSGLGLSITKNYTELHKGIIKVKSNLGEGSTFTLIIPSITNN